MFNEGFKASDVIALAALLIALATFTLSNVIKADSVKYLIETKGVHTLESETKVTFETHNSVAFANIGNRTLAITRLLLKHFIPTGGRLPEDVQRGCEGLVPRTQEFDAGSAEPFVIKAGEIVIKEISYKQSINLPPKEEKNWQQVYHCLHIEALTSDSGLVYYDMAFLYPSSPTSGMTTGAPSIYRQFNGNLTLIDRKHIALW
jgi:hypothetical protein